jgi:hypothetical protein
MVRSVGGYIQGGRGVDVGVEPAEIWEEGMHVCSVAVTRAAAHSRRLALAATSGGARLAAKILAAGAVAVAIVGWLPAAKVMPPKSCLRGGIMM